MEKQVNIEFVIDHEAFTGSITYSSTIQVEDLSDISNVEELEYNERSKAVELFLDKFTVSS